MFDYDKEKTIEQLTAALAHEVKNPVSLIKANIDYIESSDDSNQYNKNYKVIRRELDKIYSLMTDFIQLSKPIDTKNFERIYIFDLIGDIIDDCKVTLKDKRVDFQLCCSNYEISVLAEYSKIYSVFFNIYKNALEAIEENGFVKTTIDKKDSNIFINISDNGKGIPTELIDKIGTPFFTTKNNGSGLGLIVCKNIINSYNGKISIKNNENSGCNVEVILPDYY